MSSVQKPGGRRASTRGFNLGLPVEKPLDGRCFLCGLISTHQARLAHPGPYISHRLTCCSFSARLVMPSVAAAEATAEATAVPPTIMALPSAADSASAARGATRGATCGVQHPRCEREQRQAWGGGRCSTDVGRAGA